MFSVFRHSAETAALKSLGLGGAQFQPEARSTVEDFVSGHAGDLDKYEQLWRLDAITDITQSDSFGQTVHAGVMNYFNSQDRHYDEERVRSVTTKNIIEDFTLQWGLGARKIASNTTNPLKFVSAANEISSIYTSKEVADILNSFPQGTIKQIRDAIAKTAAKIWEADYTADGIVTDAAKSFLSSAEDAAGLVAVFNDPLSKQDEHLKGLQRVMNVDWYRPDPSTGILRGHANWIGSTAGLPCILPNFVKEIAELPEDTTDRRKHVRDMAVFSLANVGLEPTVDRVMQLLMQKQVNWLSLATAKGQFDGYQLTQQREIESYTQGIVGRRVPNEFRYHLKLDSSIISPRIYPPLSRRERSGTKRSGVQNQNAALTATVDAMKAVEAKLEPKTRAINYVHGNTIVALKTMEDAVDHFIPQVSKNPTLKDDIQRMLVFLSTTTNFLGSGMVRLQKEPYVMIGRKKIGLWRFAPDKCADVRVSSANRYWRIVCGVDEGNLVVKDICSHADFDKRY